MVKRRIRFGFFIIAAIFFFNPYIGTIDLLPDFIGYLFVCASISPLCEINGHFADAQKGFYKATAVAAARFALTSLMTFNNFLSNDTFILFFLFVFALLNAIFAIPALNELKRGIQYLPMYVPSKIIDRPVRRSGNTTHTDLCYIATVVFLLLHSALSVLPELFTLGVYDDIGNIDHVAQSMHSFYRAVCFFALIPIGVAWLVIVCVYFAKLCRDKDFVRSLDKLYFEKVCLNENDVLQRELKKGTGIIAAALVCSADVFVDGVNFLPSFISAALLFFAFSVMKNRISFVKRRKALCIASIVLSVVKTALEISFVDKYYYLKVTTDEVTRKAYLVLSCANLLDVAVHIILIMLQCRFRAVMK